MSEGGLPQDVVLPPSRHRRLRRALVALGLAALVGGYWYVAHTLTLWVQQVAASCTAVSP